MKRITSSFIILISLSLTLPLIGQTPILHMRMDRENDIDMSDASGHGHTAKLIGGLTFVPDRFGNDCRALQFDGTGFLRIPHSADLNISQGFTAAAWMKLPYATDLQWVTLLCKGELPKETPNSPAYRVQFTSRTSSYNSASTKTIGNIRQYFIEGQWFHLATVFDGGQFIIYQNGKETARYTVYDDLSDNREPLNIGRDIPGNTEFFKGIMDEVKLWNKVLDKKTIKKLYEDDSYKNLGSACPKPAPPATPSTPIASVPDDVPTWQDMTPVPVTQAPSAPPASQPTPRPVRPRNPSKPGLQPKPTPPPATSPATPAISDPPADPISTPAQADPLPDPFVEPAPAVVDTPAAAPLPNPDTLYSFAGIAQNNLTLVLDVSSSMKSSNRLPLLKKTFLELLQYMRDEDKISIIAFAGGSKVVLDGISATRQSAIELSIERLGSAGSTKGKPALKKALRLAKKNYIKGGNNRIIMATDGEFELAGLLPIAEDIEDQGIYLSMFSFGFHKSEKEMTFEAIAETGNGYHANITKQNVESALLRELKAIRE